MKKISLIVFASFVSFHAICQHNIGLKADGGLSRISNNYTIAYDDLSVRFAPSGNFGLFYMYKFGDKSSIGTEIILRQIQGREIWEGNTYSVNSNDIIGYHRSVVKKNVSYLSTQANYYVHFNKLAFNLGFQVSYAFDNSSRNKGYATYYSTNYTSYHNNKSSMIHILKFDLGPIIGATYNLNERISIEGKYYLGLRNIHQSSPYDQFDYVYKVHQISLGIRYKIKTFEKRNKTGANK